MIMDKVHTKKNSNIWGFYRAFVRISVIDKIIFDFIVIWQKFLIKSQRLYVFEFIICNYDRRKT